MNNITAVIEAEDDEHPVVLAYPSNEAQALTSWLAARSVPVL